MKCIILTALSIIFLTGFGQAQCPQNYEYVGGKCFLFLNNVFLGQLNAESTCENFGGNLASIKTCNQLGAVVEFIHQSGREVPDGYWISGNDVLQETQFTWSDGTLVPQGAPFWARTANESNEPQDTSGDCVAMVTGDGYYYHNVDCDSRAGFAPLCQRAKVDGVVCPSPYVEVFGVCIQPLPVLEETWLDARVVCSSSGGYLAIIDDCELMIAVIEYVDGLENIPALGYWIGGSKINGIWEWTNGQPMQMGVPFWGRNGTGLLKPDSNTHQNCLELWAHDRYYFNDVNCNPPEGRGALCEAPLLSNSSDYFSLSQEFIW